MHLARHQHVLPQQVVQRLQQFADRPGPAPQRRAAEFHTLTAVYIRLAIVRCVLSELRRDDASQRAGPRVAADGMAWSQLQHASFGRCVSITLKVLLMSSNCSDTSQPSALDSAPHTGKVVSAGDSARISRGSEAGSEDWCSGWGSSGYSQPIPSPGGDETQQAVITSPFMTQHVAVVPSLARPCSLV